MHSNEQVIEKHWSREKLSENNQQIMRYAEEHDGSKNTGTDGKS